MNVKSVERNGNQATVVVEIDKELMESGVNKAYLKARKQIMIPGFRKGKAPRKMIEAMYGAHVFYEDGLEEIFPEVYDFAVVKQDVKAIGRPSLTNVDINEENIVTLTLTTEVYPEVRVRVTMFSSLICISVRLGRPMAFRSCLTTANS